MRRLIQLYSFWYGVIGSVLAFAWFALSLAGQPVLPKSWWTMEAIAILHGAAACFTFQPYVRPPWKPLISPSPVRVRVAKVLFGLGTLNFLAWFLTLIIAGETGHRTFQERVVPLILTSLVLQNTIYIAVHWAIRPENLFSRGFIEGVSNPLGFIFSIRK